MRIAIGGISVENGSFSPLRSTLDDFVLLRGQALLTSDRYPFLGEFQVEFIPTLMARAWPGGELEPATYQALKTALLDQVVNALPLDGVYLDLHGAMKVAAMEDAEADLARAIRALVGPDTLIAASMDLHGNISHDFVAQLNMLSAYRTAPHRDMLETRHKACRMLVDALQSGRRPHVLCQPIPVLLPGERTRTDMEPGRRLWAALPALEQNAGILDASLFVGFAWVDEPRAHAAAVVSGYDRRAMEAVTATIAQSYWDARHEFHYGVEAGSIDDCIQWAIAAPESTVFISDSGDNPTAGAVGDIPLFVERLLAQPVPSALVAAIPDAETVAQCKAAGVGATVEVRLGGKLDTIHAAPLPVRGVVHAFRPGAPDAGDQVILRIGTLDATVDVLGATVDVIVTTRRKAFTEIADFEKVGIDPLAYKIVVVKLGYLFPDLLRVAPRALMALSPGASDLALERLPFYQIERPMFPIDTL